MTAQSLQSPASPDLESRAKGLRAATHDKHEILDKRIMQADPFGTRERYAKFLKVQFDFHTCIEIFYRDKEIEALIPDLRSRTRLDLIRQDLIDIGANPPFPQMDRDYLVDVPNALGWLYVAEGSNLGAAFLLKEAGKLGLSESFGARHLAGHIDGRGLHWRRFTEALDAAELSHDEDARMVEGARQAFDRVLALVEQAFYR